MIHERTCTCEHHTDDQGRPTQCGNVYGVFGHFGWGEPWISASRCGACHGCGTGRLGLSALPPEQHDVSAWVASPAADAMLGQHLLGLQRSSYSIRARLAPRFIRARGLVREGVARCGHDHLFAVELPGDAKVNAGRLHPWATITTTRSVTSSVRAKSSTTSSVRSRMPLVRPLPASDDARRVDGRGRF